MRCAGVFTAGGSCRYQQIALILAGVMKSHPNVPLYFVSPDGQPVVLNDMAQVWKAANDRVHHAHDTRVGELLVCNDMVPVERLNEALQAQREHDHRPIGQILLERGWITKEDLRLVLAATEHMPVVDCATVKSQAEALACVPREFALNRRLLPLMLRDSTLVVAMEDPWARPVLDETAFMTNLRVLPVMAAPISLIELIEDAYDAMPRAKAVPGAPSIQQLAAALSVEAPEPKGVATDANEVITESSSTLVRVVNTMIEDAVMRHASDIHIEAASPQSPVVIRFRVDGSLRPYLELPPRYLHALVARIKIMSDLDIAERRKPQDGKIDFSRFSNKAMELRVVTVPTHRGVEDVVLRLLSGTRPLPLEAIGLNSRNLATLKSVILKPYGLVLVCGPTGCGKTTSLHSVLREINTGDRKIWTAEDPIEIAQTGLCQVQVNPRIGWSFAAAMRTFLRADPDVIMIGEMRDEETARIAIEASLTGHLVLSTLHTNSAAESISRLLEMGMDPFNFSDSLLAVLAQRLVRRLCSDCAERHPASEEEVMRLVDTHLACSHRLADAAARDALLTRWARDHADSSGRLWLHRRVGCPACDGKGYKGRIGIHELLLVNEDMRHLIRHRSSAADIQGKALSDDMLTIRQDGIEKIWQGLTDLPEVLTASNN